MIIILSQFETTGYKQISSAENTKLVKLYPIGQYLQNNSIEREFRKNIAK